MLSLLLLLVALDKPDFRELKVGDAIEFAAADDPERQPHDHGFAAFVNFYREEMCLEPIAFDNDLAKQAARMLDGHPYGHEHAPHRLVGRGSATNVFAMWGNAPEMAKVLFDPEATRFGIAQRGSDREWVLLIR